MKIKFLTSIIALILIAMACDPIEDKSARDEFAKTGAPISVEDLNAALSVSQPVPHANQYVVLHNSRTDIPGTWFIQTSTGTVQRHTDHDTILYMDNDIYEIYFVGLSEKQRVTSKIFHVSVSDLPIDEYANFLSGATTSNIAAEKAWTLVNRADAVHDGMCWGWKYYQMLSLPVTNTYAGLATATELAKTVVFRYAKKQMEIYAGDGTKLYDGNWTCTHETHEDTVGELITTIPILGANYNSWNVQHTGPNSPYWILSIDENNFVLCLPGVRVQVKDGGWDDHALYFFFEAKK